MASSDNKLDKQDEPVLTKVEINENDDTHAIVILLTWTSQAGEVCQHAAKIGKAEEEERRELAKVFRNSEPAILNSAQIQGDSSTFVVAGTTYNAQKC